MLRVQNNASSWGFINQWFPHCLSITNAVIKEKLNTESAAEFLDGTSNYLGKHARYNEALAISKEALQIRERLLDNDKSESVMSLATSLNNLGLLYKDLNKIDKAIVVTERANKLMKKVLPQDAPAMLTTLTNLAAFYVLGNRDEEGFELMAQVLKLWQSHSDPDYEELSSVLNIMAALFKKREQYDKAVLLAEQALKYIERSPQIDPIKLGSVDIST